MKQTIDYLKSRFKRGSKPTEQDFFDMFESFVHMDSLDIEIYSGLMNCVKNGEPFIMQGINEDGTSPFKIMIQKIEL